MAHAPERILPEPLSTAFKREHREIDDAVLAAARGTADQRNRQPLAGALHTLRRHIYAEEEFMFPALRDAGLVGPVLVMLREHAQMWQLLDTIDNFIAADLAADALADGCTRLLDLLQRHNPKEETILYPQVDALLDAEPASVLRQLLIGGDLPTDWRCQHLR